MLKLWILSISPFSKIIFLSKVPEKTAPVKCFPESTQKKAFWVTFTRKYSSFNKLVATTDLKQVAKPKGSMRFSWFESLDHWIVPITKENWEGMKAWEKTWAMIMEFGQTGLYKNLELNKNNRRPNLFRQDKSSRCN